MHLRFGKYAGVNIDHVPLTYLEWSLKSCSNLTDFERETISKSIEKRDFSKLEVKKALQRLNPPQWNDVLELHLIDEWFFKMACEYSPGKVGNSLQLDAIKVGHDLLKRLVKDAKENT